MQSGIEDRWYYPKLPEGFEPENDDEEENIPKRKPKKPKKWKRRNLAHAVIDNEEKNKSAKKAAKSKQKAKQQKLCFNLFLIRQIKCDLNSNFTVVLFSTSESKSTSLNDFGTTRLRVVLRVTANWFIYV